MINFDTSSMLFVTVWSLAAVAVGLTCGYFIGRWYTMHAEPKNLRRDREKTLAAMLKLLKSTKELNDDVDCHNSALNNARQELGGIQTEGDYANLQTMLMSNIEDVVESNRRLEHDLVVTQYKLEAQAQELDRSRDEARTDALCKVGNRKAVDETLTYMVSRFQSKKVSFGLMLIDVDHFKRINDTFGHTAGDEALSSIAIALKECVRPTDFVGRLGGDEFVVMFDGLKEVDARAVGDRIRAAIELYDFSINGKGQSTVATLSMGLAIVRPADTAETIYKRSDAALYRAKELGRNRLFTVIDDSDLNPEGQQPAPPVPAPDVTPGFSSYEQFKASFDDA
jgi:diguanylate cyclase